MAHSRLTNDRGLTELEQEFCHKYVWHFSDVSGERSAPAAARDAGYAESSAANSAARLLKKQEVRLEIVRLSEELFHEAVPLAVATMVELLSTGTNAIRKAAAERVLDQAGLGIIARTESTVVVKDHRTPEEMLARLKELAELHPELQKLLPAPVVDAEFVEVPSSEVHVPSEDDEADEEVY